jgi:hypothetical protein
MMKICPKCNQPYSWTVEMGPDYVHRCNSGKEAVDQEPVLKTGDWEDYTGSGTVASPQHQGRGTKASGKALLENQKVHTLNKWGKIKRLYRQRQHYEYIPIEVK